jgi:hypothetical protein
MNDELLEQSLRHVDASEVAPPSPPDFGANVRRIVARRRRRNTVVAVSSTLGLLIAATLLLFRPESPHGAPQVASLDEQLATLRNELRELDQTISAQRTAQEEREARLQRLLEPDPRFELQIHVETVAALRFAEAEQSAAAGDNEHAQECYERVVALFPQSRSGVAAQGRIAQLKRN